VALTEDGAIWTCGSGVLPTRLGPEVFVGLPVVLVACGLHINAMALTGGGCIWTLGLNDYGQLGHGDRTGKQLFTREDPGHFRPSTFLQMRDVCLRVRSEPSVATTDP
jgi:alpha-tubulin suppressor-like RCC1 family protein